jgi:hypothetical protein
MRLVNVKMSPLSAHWFNLFVSQNQQADWQAPSKVSRYCAASSTEISREAANQE